MFIINPRPYFYISKKQYSSKESATSEVVDYAKLMEPDKVRKRRYFSIGIICFTAAIYALSISIVVTSAKPYLDELSDMSLNDDVITIEIRGNV